MTSIPNPNDVVVSFWSEYDKTLKTQVMSIDNARQQWARLSEMQKSVYSIRAAEPDDYETSETP